MMQPKAQLRRQKIMDEAISMFRQKGYSATTLRQLAAKAGIQGGSIYHHFASKQDILFEIMLQAMNALIQGVVQAAGETSDPFEKLRRAIGFHIEYHTQYADQTFVTDAELRSLAPANYMRIIALRDQYEGFYVHMLEDGIKNGGTHIQDVKLAARALLQMCTGISYWYKPGGRLGIDELTETYTELFFHGIKGKGDGK